MYSDIKETLYNVSLQLILELTKASSDIKSVDSSVITMSWRDTRRSCECRFVLPVLSTLRDTFVNASVLTRYTSSNQSIPLIQMSLLPPSLSLLPPLSLHISALISPLPPPGVYN